MTAPGVVITPELFGRALIEPAAYRVLRLWRDGRLSPSVNRPLLKRYLQVLKGMGIVGEPLLRAWVWTWTRNVNVYWDEGTELEKRDEDSAWEICQNLARARGVPILLSDGADGGGEASARDVDWLSLSGFPDWMRGKGLAVDEMG